MRAAAVGLALGAVALTACGDVDAENQPFVGTVLYADPAGAFELRLLQPPWLPPLVLEGETIFIVPPQDATISTDPGIVLGEALHSLQIGPRVSGTPEAVAQGVTSGLPGSVMPVRREVRTASGAAGVELSWEEGPAVFRREAFVAAAGGSTFHLRFRARNPNADDAMIGQMINSFEPAP